MKLRGKILAGFLTLSAMLAIAGVWSITHMNWMSENVQNIIDNNYKSINAAKRLMQALEREDSAILLIINGEHSDYEKTLMPADSSFRKNFEIAKSNITIPGEELIIANIKNSYDSLSAKFPELKEGSFSREWYFHSIHDNLLEVMNQSEKLLSLNDEELYKNSKNMTESANRALMPGIIAIIAAIVFSLLFSYFINYYLIKPIRDITDEITKFIKVKKSFSYEAESRDEIFDLANSVRLLTSRATEIDKNS